MTVVVEIRGRPGGQYDIEGARKDVERHLTLLPPDSYIDATRIASALVGAVLSLETLTKSGFTLEKSKFELRQNGFDGEVIGRAAIIFHAKMLEKEEAVRIVERPNLKRDLKDELLEVNVTDIRHGVTLISELKTAHIIATTPINDVQKIDISSTIEPNSEIPTPEPGIHDPRIAEDKTDAFEIQSVVTVRQLLIDSEFGIALHNLFNDQKNTEDEFAHVQILIDGLVEMITKKGVQEENRLTADEVKHVSFLLGVRIERTNKGYRVNHFRRKPIKEIRQNANRGKGSVDAAEESVYSGLKKIVEYILPSTSLNVPAA